MKVLHITNAYPSHENPIKGVFIKEQIESLSNEHLQNTVYFIDKSKGGITQYFKAIKYTFEAKKDYDVIHAHHVFSAITVILAGGSKKLVTSFLSDGPSEVMIGPKFIKSFIFKMAYKFSKKRIFKLKSRVGDDANNYFIQNGVETNFFIQGSKKECKEKLGLEPDSKYVLFVSGQNLYRPEKRYDLFLRTIEEANKKKPSSLKSILPLAISNVTREDIVIYYNAADCYLLTSDFEGSPNAIKEALACGTPVVSRNVGSAEELLYNIPGCSTVEGENIQKLAENVIKAILLDDSSVREAFIKKKLSTQSVAKKISHIYELITRENHSEFKK